VTSNCCHLRSAKWWWDGHNAYIKNIEAENSQMSSENSCLSIKAWGGKCMAKPRSVCIQSKATTCMMSYKEGKKGNKSTWFLDSSVRVLDWGFFESLIRYIRYLTEHQFNTQYDTSHEYLCSIKYMIHSYTFRMYATYMSDLTLSTARSSFYSTAGKLDICVCVSYQIMVTAGYDTRYISN